MEQTGSSNSSLELGHRGELDPALTLFLRATPRRACVGHRFLPTALAPAEVTVATLMGGRSPLSWPPPSPSLDRCCREALHSSSREPKYRNLTSAGDCFSKSSSVFGSSCDSPQGTHPAAPILLSLLVFAFLPLFCCHRRPRCRPLQRIPLLRHVFCFFLIWVVI